MYFININIYHVCYSELENEKANMLFYMGTIY